MRMRGLEPPRGCPHTDLNRARLPIPPHPRGGASVAAARPGYPERQSADIGSLTIAAYHPSALVRGLVLAVLVFAVAAPAAHAADRRVEVMVELDGPPLARAVVQSRTLTSAAKRQRLDVRSPLARTYTRRASATSRRASRPRSSASPARRSAGATASSSTPSPSSCRSPGSPRCAASTASGESRRSSATAPASTAAPRRSTRPRCGARSPPAAATGSRSGSSTTASTRPIRSSTRPASPTRRASRRGRRRTRRRR